MSQFATLAEFAVHGIPAAATSNLAPETITAALVAASSVAESYFRKRHTLPILEWDEATTQHVCALAAYNLIGARGFAATGNDAQLERRRDVALRWFERVAAGMVEPQIVDSTPSVEEAGPLGGSEGDPLFSVGRGYFARSRSTCGGCGEL